jgi:hypothetical protein
VERVTGIEPVLSLGTYWAGRRTVNLYEDIPFIDETDSLGRTVVRIQWRGHGVHKAIPARLVLWPA